LGDVTEGEKVALFTLARAIVLPSWQRSEAFGVALLEGAMLSKPMISTELGTGTSYVNVDGQTGYVVPVGDPKALADAMQTLHDDLSLATQMGLTARARWEKFFTGSEMGRSYANMYYDCIVATEKRQLRRPPEG
jgi:rhamnosyl/mannosyltransferase